MKLELIKKPPLGLYPRIFYVEDRIRAIQAVFKRYEKAEKTPLEEWVNEFNSLVTLHENLKMELNSELDRLGNLVKFSPVLKEQLRQVKKWGIQDHSPEFYYLILGEEMGEVAEAILKTVGEGSAKTWKDVIRELTEVQAVAQSMVESIERNELNLINKKP